MALRVPEPDSVTAGAGQPTQGTCTVKKQRGPWGWLGLAHPVHAGKQQQPEKAQGEGGQTDVRVETGALSPSPSFPRSLEPSQGRGKPEKSPDETFKPSWTPSLTPSPHPCWTGGLGQPQARYTKAPSSAAPKNAHPPFFPGTLRPSHPFLQLSRSLLSPPLRSPSPRSCQ